MATPAHIATLFVLIAFLARALIYSAQSDATAFVSNVSDATEANILLLTAHPDDECMFFAPTLLGISSWANSLEGEKSTTTNLHSLCLSVGNADALGNVRRDELSKSLDVLGIDENRRQLIDVP